MMQVIGRFLPILIIALLVLYIGKDVIKRKRDDGEYLHPIITITNLKIAVWGLALLVAMYLAWWNKKVYGDGVYCAEIHYFNPETRTSSTYYLPVEVYDSRPVTIYFRNGGELSSDHFDAPEFNAWGSSKFVDDRGRHFKILGLFDGECEEYPDE